MDRVQATIDVRYPAARTVAPRVHEYFARHARTLAYGDTSAAELIPDSEAIEAMVDSAFWASLRREEGYAPRVSLALVPPTQATHPLRFERALPLAPASLVRIAPAVERRGIHLGVWRNGDVLEVWGTTWMIPPSCFVLEVVGPGLLVVKHQRDGGGKFVNVAVLEGDQVKIIDERASAMPDCPLLVTSLLGFNPRGTSDSQIDVLVQLAVSMRAHGRGGTLLIVRDGSDGWRESIVRPVSYAIEPAFGDLAAIVRNVQADPDSNRWNDALDEAVHAVAGLTAVDGATILSDKFDVLAFGAKIVRRDGSPMVEQVAVTEPIEGGAPAVMHPTGIGGTRHLSAIQFVHDQREAMALVASQDGRFTLFAWSPCEEIVHAHRVESLLL
jgi:hypothetical protein